MQHWWGCGYPNIHRAAYHGGPKVCVNIRRPLFYQYESGLKDSSWENKERANIKVGRKVIVLLYVICFSREQRYIDGAEWNAAAIRARLFWGLRDFLQFLQENAGRVLQIMSWQLSSTFFPIHHFIVRQCIMWVVRTSLNKSYRPINWLVGLAIGRTWNTHNKQ